MHGKKWPSCVESDLSFHVGSECSCNIWKLLVRVKYFNLDFEMDLLFQIIRIYGVLGVLCSL